MASTVAVLECANDLLQAKKSKSRFDHNTVFVKLTDAVSLLGHVNHELVGKRRKATLKRGIPTLVHCKYSYREIIVWRRFSQKAMQCKRDESLL